MKRVTLFAGHYGSGKTNIAVNWALKLRETHERVLIADLDIVNPYFRTKDSLEERNKAGIRLISSEYANSNVDLPALPTEMYSITDDTSSMAVVDIGGDDRGAYALGRYAPGILEENDFDMLFVVNMYRPLTTTAKDTIEVLYEIEAACHMPFTGIVNNSNLGDMTTTADILASLPYANEIAEKAHLPVRFTSVRADLAPALEGQGLDILPLTLQKKYY